MKKLLLLLLVFVFSCSDDNNTTNDIEKINNQAPNTIVLKELKLIDNGCGTATSADGTQSPYCSKYFHAYFKSTYSENKKGNVKYYIKVNGVPQTVVRNNAFYFEYHVGSSLVQGNPLKANDVTVSAHVYSSAVEQKVELLDAEFIEN